MYDQTEASDTRKTFNFDLDETLMYCANPSLDDIISFRHGTCSEQDSKSVLSPKSAFRLLPDPFEVIMFTASESCYADVVLDFNSRTDTASAYRNNCVYPGVSILKICQYMVLMDKAALSLGISRRMGSHSVQLTKSICI